jgi:hypothetical protein
MLANYGINPSFIFFHVCLHFCIYVIDSCRHERNTIKNTRLFAYLDSPCPFAEFYLSQQNLPGDFINPSDLYNRLSHFPSQLYTVQTRSQNTAIIFV